MNNQTHKADAGKPRLDLIPPETLLALGKTLHYGTIKYKEGSWKRVAIKRYIGAMLRHLIAWQLEEEFDAESNLHHLDHMLCNAAFIQFLGTKNGRNNLPKSSTTD